jgi:hypothetical protein
VDPVASEPGSPKGKPSLLDLLDLYGICKEMYAADGGGEAFIRAQREDFGSSVPDDFVSQGEMPR